MVDDYHTYLFQNCMDGVFDSISSFPVHFAEDVLDAQLKKKTWTEQSLRLIAIGKIYVGQNQAVYLDRIALIDN